MAQEEIEQLLLRYRPARPPAGLREKVLAERAVRRWPTYLFRAGIAALLVVSIGLIHAADGLTRTTAAQIGVGPPRWTPEAEEAAKLVDPGPAGRQYIALCLIAGNNAAFGQPQITPANEGMLP